MSAINLLPGPLVFLKRFCTQFETLPRQHDFVALVGCKSL